MIWHLFLNIIHYLFLVNQYFKHLWASNEQNYVDFFFCIFLYHFQIDIKYIKCVSITIYSMLTIHNSVNFNLHLISCLFIPNLYYSTMCFMLQIYGNSFYVCMNPISLCQAAINSHTHRW